MKCDYQRKFTLPASQMKWFQKETIRMDANTYLLLPISLQIRMESMKSSSRSIHLMIISCPKSKQEHRKEGTRYLWNRKERADRACKRLRKGIRWSTTDWFPSSLEDLTVDHQSMITATARSNWLIPSNFTQRLMHAKHGNEGMNWRKEVR